MQSRLTYCEQESEVEVVKLIAGKGAISNFNNLGLAIGDYLKIKKVDDSHGPVEIHYKGREINIGFELASKIIVETNSINPFSLDRARIGDFVEVSKINASGEIRRRLMDMGVIKGAKIEVLRCAPLGDPIQLKMNGFNLSLRINEAKQIIVNLIKVGSDIIPEKKKRLRLSWKS